MENLVEFSKNLSIALFDEVNKEVEKREVKGSELILALSTAMLCTLVDFEVINNKADITNLPEIISSQFSKLLEMQNESN